MATPRTQSVGGWVVLCARSLGGDVGGSHSRPRSREEQGRARLDGRWPAFAGAEQVRSQRAKTDVSPIRERRAAMAAPAPRDAKRARPAGLEARVSTMELPGLGAQVTSC